MGIIARSVQPEVLDQLEPDDPRALRSRRDLARINWLLAQSAIMARLLRKMCSGEPPRTILDLGGGDGRFMLQVARRLAPAWRGVALTVLDRRGVVEPETRADFAALGWTVQSAAADVLDYLENARAPKVDLITANLFLHHFPAAPLVRLLAGVARRTDRFVACETLRRPIALLASQMVWAAGCSADTRNDAVLSVRAGFDGRELSELWPEREGWELNERRVLLTHRFAARRIAP